MDKIGEISRIILDESSSREDLKQACEGYFELLTDLAELEPGKFSADASSESGLANGVAISPLDAGRCVLDHIRTSQFIRSASAAITEIRKRSGSKRVNVLYAGCGPFAALILPVLLNEKPGDLKVSVIDAHSRSLESVENISRKLGLEEFFAEFIQADAGEIDFPDDRNFDLIIVEAMQKALENEPQAAISKNLSKYLNRSGVFLPESIIVSVFMADPSIEFSDMSKSERVASRIYLGKVLELAPINGTFLDAVKMEIPPGGIYDMSLFLSTQIRVFDRYFIDEYESGLTSPSEFGITTANKRGETFEIYYESGERPRFASRRS